MISYQFRPNTAMPKGATAPKKDPRAVELGEWLMSRRLAKGLKRPEAVQLGLQHDPRAALTPDYLSKLEYGTRSLASAALDVREAIREALGISREAWERETGLATGEPRPLTHAERRGWVLPEEEEPEIPEALQIAAEKYGHGENAPLAEREWLLELADLDFREEPETPEDWLAIYSRLSKLIKPKKGYN